MNKNTYEPETLEEEFAFLVGRVAALEAVMNKDDSDYIKKKMWLRFLELSSKVKKSKVWLRGYGEYHAEPRI